MNLNEKEFTNEEITFINQFESNVPFRVLQTTIQNDLVVLRNPCAEIKTNNLNLAHLIQRIHATVINEQSKGVGIAAPQIGINRQVILVQRLDKLDKAFEFFINPKITWKSDILREGEEGCLSIPDNYQLVKRSLIIEIEFQNLDGLIHKEIVEGYTAVIFQHEIDHLNGVLFIDYIKIHPTENYQLADKVHNLVYKK